MKWILYPSTFKAIQKLIIVFTVLFLLFGISTVKAQLGVTQFNILDLNNDGSRAEFGTPTNANVDDGVAIELGIKFRVNQPGTVNNIIFYNGGLATGTNTHIGNLWRVSDGALLGSVTFTSGSATNTYVTSPALGIHIIPGETYVASYRNNGVGGTPEYRYSVTDGTFPAADYTAHPPFTIIGATASASDPTHPNNGVFAIGAGLGSIPSSYAGVATNYYVDILLTLDFPLPVSLTNLKATPENKNVAISWQTASESNNKGFEIQRSNNNADWYSIGFVNGAGNSSSTLNYSFTDKEPSPGKYYYRLNQMDLDNRSKLSATVSATISGKGKISLFQNAPNPVRTTTQIRFDLPERQQVRLTVMDMTGREVQTLVNKTAEQGSHVITFNAASLSKQLYIIRLQTETEIITKQMLVE